MCWDTSSYTTRPFLLVPSILDICRPAVVPLYGALSLDAGAKCQLPLLFTGQRWVNRFRNPCDKHLIHTNVCSRCVETPVTPASLRNYVMPQATVLIKTSRAHQNLSSARCEVRNGFLVFISDLSFDILHARDTGRTSQMPSKVSSLRSSGSCHCCTRWTSATISYSVRKCDYIDLPRGERARSKHCPELNL